MTYPIVIPLHHHGGKLRDDTELRFAIRSIHKYFEGNFEICIVGRKLPDWLKDCRHIKGKGLKSSLASASRAYPRGFFWYYDDTCLLRPTTPEEMKFTPAKNRWPRPKTNWAADLEKIRIRLEREGYDAWDYSRPHGPYWFTKSMVDEGFADWPGLRAKFPWESWILSKRDHPRVDRVSRQYYHEFERYPKKRHRYLNYNDKGFTPELRAYLRVRFPDMCPFESSPPAAIEHTEKTPLTHPGRLVKFEVHTIRFGNEDWMGRCAPTMDAWCEKNGHKLKVWGKREIDRKYPSAKFCQIDMLKEFLEGDSEWIMYADADVYVSSDAPAHPDFSALKGFCIMPDQEWPGRDQWDSWCKEQFGTGNKTDGWIYRNAGVWVCDREAAAKMLSVISPPFIEKQQEQHQWNWWLCRAVAEQGLTISDLPREWNNFPQWHQSAAFYHLAGSCKMTRLAVLEERGLIDPKWRPPRSGVIGKWIDAHDDISTTFDYGSIKPHHAESHFAVFADLVILDGVLEQLCNGAASQTLLMIDRGRWKYLIVSSTPGAKNASRRGMKNGKIADIDVEAIGGLRDTPSERIKRPGGEYLIYHRAD